MSVRNGGDSIVKTVESILGQRGVNLEFIIVNDGSTDQTSKVLRRLEADDQRIRLLTRSGQGLTASLIDACKIARGNFIARQDASDISMPDRLYTQAMALLENPLATLCSSHVKFVTEEGVTALISCSTEAETSKGFNGIVHGSVMMKRDAYLQVKGYRKQFYYSQDVDLWSRLVEIGNHIIIPEVLYESCLTPGSISGSRRKEQARFHKFIVKASQARRTGKDEDFWLIKAAQYSEKCRENSKHIGNKAGGAYFIGACLFQKHPEIAKRYLHISIDNNPFHLRSRLKLLGIK